MQKAIFTGFRLVQEPRKCTDRKGRTYYLFGAASINPGRNGNNVVCDFRVNDKWLVPKFEAYKIRQGSCLDMTAEISSYVDSDGRPHIGFEVTEFTFAECQAQTYTKEKNGGEVTPEKKHEEQTKAADKKAAEILDLLSKQNFSF